jgi:hypothetical protein
MTAFNRNDLWRIKRTMNHLNKALDSLTRAGGELRPKQFDKLREELTRILGDTEDLLVAMEKAQHAAHHAQKPLDLDLDDDEQAEAAE